MNNCIIKHFNFLILFFCLLICFSKNSKTQKKNHNNYSDSETKETINMSLIGVIALIVLIIIILIILFAYLCRKKNNNNNNIKFRKNKTSSKLNNSAIINSTSLKEKVRFSIRFAFRANLSKEIFSNAPQTFNFFLVSI